MKPRNSSKKAILVWSSVCLVIGVIFFVVNVKLINILEDKYSVTAKVTKTAKIIQVERNQTLVGTSVAYIIDNPEGSGRIPIEETDDYARYNAGDKIQLTIIKYKNGEPDIYLKK